MKLLTAILFLPLILAASVLQAPVAPVYVAPYGVMSAAGTADDPQSLSTALSSGGHVYLLPGTYTGDVTVSTPGTTLESAPGTRAKIDGGVTVAGAGSTVSGLEIFDGSWQTRASATPAQLARRISVTAPNVTIERNWIHDLALGISAYDGSGGGSAGLVIRHNLIANIGYGSTGHALYLQNDDAGRKTVEGNIILPGYSAFGLHIYGSSAASLRHFDILGNTFTGRTLIGGGSPADDITVRANRLYSGTLQLGYSATITNGDVLVSDNYLAGPNQVPIQFTRWQSATVERNTLVRGPGGSGIRTIANTTAQPGAWASNQYWSGGGASTPFNAGGFKTWAWWGANVDSTGVYTPTLPAANAVFVDAWGLHRGSATIFNWTQAPTVTLDLTPLDLTPGASYALVNAQNPAERQTFTAGTPVTIPMAGWTVATPYGTSAPLRSWDNRFAVFLVEPLS